MKFHLASDRFWVSAIAAGIAGLVALTWLLVKASYKEEFSSLSSDSRDEGRLQRELLSRDQAKAHAERAIMEENLRYLSSEQSFVPLSQEKTLLSKIKQSKRTYVAQFARPMLKEKQAMSLEDLGIELNSKQSLSFLGKVETPKDLARYRPVIEEELVLQAAKRAQKKRMKMKSQKKSKVHFAGAASAIRQLKSAAKMGSIALEIQDPDSQAVLSRAFVTGEDAQEAIEKARQESGKSTSKPIHIGGGGWKGWLLSALEKTGVLNWSSKLSGQEIQSVNFGTVNQEESCSVCGTVSWEGILVGPGYALGPEAPVAGNPYVVNVSPSKLKLAVSILDVQQAEKR